MIAFGRAKHSNVEMKLTVAYKLITIWQTITMLYRLNALQCSDRLWQLHTGEM